MLHGINKNNLSNLLQNGKRKIKIKSIKVFIYFLRISFLMGKNRNVHHIVFHLKSTSCFLINIKSCASFQHFMYFEK